MGIRLLSLIFILTIGMGAGLYLYQDPGYLLLSYRNWTLEMPLWLAGLLLLTGMIFFLFIIKCLNILLSSRQKMKNWWFNHQQKTARLSTLRGLLDFTEGYWQKAEHALIRGARFHDMPLLNYLMAAKAADAEGAFDRRDHYLQQAYALNTNARIVVQLVEAELRFKQGEFEHSLAILQHLHAAHPKHPSILKQLCTVYEVVQDWYSLFQLLPELQKLRSCLSKPEETALQCKIYHALLPASAKENTTDLIKFWRNAPKTVQTDRDCVSLYIKLLMQKNADTEAEIVLRALLKNSWYDEWGYLYGLIQDPFKRQIKFAETILLKQQPNNAVLLLTLGRLCLNEQLLGKARDYLEQHIKLQPSAVGFALLAELMDQLGFPEKRNEYYKKGCCLAQTPLDIVNTHVHLKRGQQSSNTDHMLDFQK